MPHQSSDHLRLSSGRSTTHSFAGKSCWPSEGIAPYRFEVAKMVPLSALLFACLRPLSRFPSRAQEVRARGGVSAEQKEELQQVSRKAKRAAKRQEEERQKVHDAGSDAPVFFFCLLLDVARSCLVAERSPALSRRMLPAMASSSMGREGVDARVGNVSKEGCR